VHRGRTARFATAAAVAFAVLAAACTSDGSDDSADPAPPTTDGSGRTTTSDGSPAWQVDETDTGLLIDTGAARLVVDTAEGLELALTRPDDEPVTADAPDGGLFVARGDTRAHVATVIGTTLGTDHASFVVTFDDGTNGIVEVGAAGDHGFVVRVTPDDAEGVTGWGTDLALADDEAIYGLTERIVDDGMASEIVPEEVGSLDRRGEEVTMYVAPTMSGYVPFHQSSQGYGLLVDGFMPGQYEIGTGDAPDVLSFEFEMDPDERAGSYHLFYGPDHPTILEQYYAATGWPAQPPDTVFLHWRGRDELPIDEPVTYEGVAMNASVASDLEAYAGYDLPAGIYHFDRPWAVGQEGFGELRFDPERFPDAEAMLSTMADAGWTTEVWISPWAIGERGEVAAANGWLAPHSPRALDLTNPDAVAWLQDDVAAFLASDEGQYVDGFFMDRGDEPDVTSTADDVYSDGRNGRQIHNWYPVAFAEIMREVIDEARPDDGFLIARPGYTGSQASVMRWGGDTHSREGLAIPEAPVESAPSTDLGLRSVLISVQRAAFMGTPYWGSDIAGYTAWADPEVFARWTEVGFASPLMRFHGMGGTPWATTLTGEPDPELIDIYRRYLVMRHDPVMQAYLSDASHEAATTGTPMVRPLVFAWPEEEGALDRWDQWLLGPDLLVAPVWESGAREREVWIPPGEWIDFWDRTATVEGPTTITVDARLDELPMWISPDSPLLDLEVPYFPIGDPID
jgi:alpha-D-xyloside xylohydrolase